MISKAPGPRSDDPEVWRLVVAFLVLESRGGVVHHVAEMSDCVHACVHACVCVTCIRVCPHLCVCDLCPCIHAYVCETCVPVSMPVCVTCVAVCPHLCM